MGGEKADGLVIEGSSWWPGGGLKKPPADMVVPHVQQHFTWDCGLACCLMALRGLGASSLELPALHALCPTTSIWTVDLAHLLRRFRVEVLFLTITLGANPGYASASFYAGSMPEDARRVERLFRGAAAAGVVVRQRALSGAEVKRVVTSRLCLVVCLVDKRRLPMTTETTTVGVTGDATAVGGGRDGAGGAAGASEAGATVAGQSAKRPAGGVAPPAAARAPWGHVGGTGGAGGASTDTPSVADRPPVSAPSPVTSGDDGGGYTGHYVLLVGYDPATRCYAVRDPAAGDAAVAVAEASLESARRAYGTDEDLLLIPTSRPGGVRTAVGLLEALGPLGAAVRA